MGTRNSLPWGKGAGAWSYTFTPQYTFMAWCSPYRKMCASYDTTVRTLQH